MHELWADLELIIRNMQFDLYGFNQQVMGKMTQVRRLFRLSCTFHMVLVFNQCLLDVLLINEVDSKIEYIISAKKIILSRIHI